MALTNAKFWDYFVFMLYALSTGCVSNRYAEPGVQRDCTGKVYAWRKYLLQY